jgi:uncharacterized FlgJ-related protein
MNKKQLLVLLIGALVISGFSLKQAVSTYNKVKFNILYFRLQELGVLYPRVFIAQSILESKVGKSTIGKENSNWWGLKRPKYRQTTAIGENRGHAVFSTVGAAAIDYVYRQDYWRQVFEKRYYPIESEDDYIAMLTKEGMAFAEDPDYENKLRLIIERDLNFLPNF